MGKNNINGKTFLEKRYSEDLELEVRPAFNVPVYIYQALRYMNTPSNAKVFHRSNHMYELKHFGMVWQRRIRERCCGAHREPHF
jgi:hypothetical protein